MPQPPNDKPAEWADAIEVALSTTRFHVNGVNFLRSVQRQCQGIGREGQVITPFISEGQRKWVSKRICDQIPGFWDMWKPGLQLYHTTDNNKPDDSVICPFDAIIEE